MRIGINCSSSLGGKKEVRMKTGIGHYISCLVENLLDIDDSNEYVLFYSYLTPSRRQHIPSFNGKRVKVKILRLPSEGVLIPLWAHLSFPPMDWLIGEVDVFHAPSAIAPPLKRGRLVYTIFDLVNLKFPAFHTSQSCQPFMKKVASSARRAQAVITLSECSKRDIVELLGIEEEKIKVIPLAARSIFRPVHDEKAIERVRRKYGLLSPYLLFAGTLEPRKNLPRLLEAFQLLKGRFKEPLTLAVTGGKGWLYEEIFTKAEELSLGEEAKFLGYVSEEELPLLMNGAEGFIYPSLYEGFGLPPLEAMACGTPCITSNLSSLPEVVGDAALLADPYDVEGMASAMERLLVDSTLRKELKEKGLRRAMAFSWQETARRTLEVYTSIR